MAGHTGQTLNDRLNAARYALAGQGLARVVCKATTEEVIGPKKKHLDCMMSSIILFEFFRFFLSLFFNWSQIIIVLVLQFPKFFFLSSMSSFIYWFKIKSRFEYVFNARNQLKPKFEKINSFMNFVVNYRLTPIELKIIKWIIDPKLELKI
jgi:hypothetical protein